jgi:sigma-E factor negative regulatory protein RseA
VAAGFVVVVGALVVVSQAPQPQATESAQLVPTAPLAVVTAASAPSASSPEFVANGEVIRDPQLDRYLFAHKQFSGSTVLGAPSGFLRNAAAEAPAR